VTLAGSGDRRDAEALLRDADLAMYRAKADGRRQIRVFDAGLRQQAVTRHTLEHHLRRVLRGGTGLAVHYQPVVRLRTGGIVGVEALCRWTDEALGVIPPAQFIPVAEDSGLIVPLGHHVLATACRQGALWRAELGEEAPQVAVNISPHQLLTGAHLVDQVRDCLAESRLPASALCLEITESSVVAETTAAHTAVAALADLGVHIALDDFGTGYSSLSNLTSLPVRTLKIDHSHVSQIHRDPRCLQVVRGVVGLARGLGMRTVAEGAETTRHLKTLAHLGCDDVQGWAISRAVPADELTPLLRTCRRGGSALPDGVPPSDPTGC